MFAYIAHANDTPSRLSKIRKKIAEIVEIFDGLGGVMRVKSNLHQKIVFIWNYGFKTYSSSAPSCFSTDAKLILGISMYSNTFSLECLSITRMDAQIECSWNIFHWDWFGVSLLCTYISNEKTILPSSNQADVCDNVDWKLQFLQSFIYWPMYKFIWWFMDFQKN